MLTTEGQRDGHFRWVVQYRIGAHKNAVLHINTEEQGGVEPVRILPQFVKLSTILGIRSVVDLELVLVVATILIPIPHSYAAFCRGSGSDAMAVVIQSHLQRLRTRAGSA